jgi:signal transduction histidine kinase
VSKAARIELAREIHDGIAQDLVSLGYDLDLLLASQSASAQSRMEIRTLRFKVDEMISKVRREMYSLRDPKFTTLQEELGDIARDICGELLTWQEIDELSIPSEIQEELKSIAIELLRNAKTHSRASQIELLLKGAQNRTYLEVSDNGVGGAVIDTSRLGLVGVKERVHLLNGQFEISSTQHGTRVKIIL